MITDYHAKYYAYAIKQRSSQELTRLSHSLFDAAVDLNPHQIEAALFALRSPISKGVILADEVGLGKTIEAGLVLCQFWAERKRKLLIICPASIRKQWSLELEEKFFLPTIILDAKSFKESMAQGNPNPFDCDRIVITSMHYASRMAHYIRAVNWDLVVIDEAHKLRNLYRPSNRIGQNIKFALEDRPKILLTATPLQNSLLELYGLSLLIDERIFGDLKAFRAQYMGRNGNLLELRERLQKFCYRTLRRQVTEYIRYTERRLITQPFTPSDDEQGLYEAISSYLQREDTYAFPKRHRHLMILIARKLLASSPRAVAAMLEALRDRLIELRDGLKEKDDSDLLERILNEEELESELIEEDTEPEEELSTEEIDLQKLEAEISELDSLIRWAKSIGIDSKARALLKALEIGFKKMEEMGAARKAVIFTESRRTQQFLKDFLEANGYAGRIVTFSGTNTDPESHRIYEKWLEVNAGTGRITGNKQVDIRTALIEHFRDYAEILIATEAGAEGINLQFCSLVINYDLPWNPQRIEQRIGRCHRYGQKFDVVVINFLNQRNAADQRVYELLTEKFRLFTGLFGASDEVLGAIESGVDFEKRVLEIYQTCRTPEEIDEAFRKLQKELDEKIKSTLAETRRKLLEHFDEEVHERLKLRLSETEQYLDRLSRMFWGLTKNILKDCAKFDDKSLSFELYRSPIEGIPLGRYYLKTSQSSKKIGARFLYRFSHPLGEYVLNEGQKLPTPPMHVIFDITNHPARITVIENLKGQSGWIHLQRLVIESFQKEEYLLFSGVTDEGQSLDQEICEKLFLCGGEVEGPVQIPQEVAKRLEAETERHVQATIARSLEENNRYFQEAREQLEKWADDMILAAEQELNQTKEQIKALRRQARLAATLEEQHKIQRKLQELERKKRRLRQKIFDIEDEILAKRDELIEQLERRLRQKTYREPLFTIRWSVI
ncbi:SNF2-related protein [Thermosulfurimonas dismutans]|uniref:Helicase (Snf2/Rad54 family) n=1 Tax=Thermosulfurimonas dismutans TaxID=999894 RepID=A0A179D3M9_9BACT|nr:SNF2-related protein [Thermosulfurimonas dismutans]OAQ20646.1 helicase (Snf2/Rad54 family) [Thermosulfurimonas dismutans]